MTSSEASGGDVYCKEMIQFLQPGYPVVKVVNHTTVIKLYTELAPEFGQSAGGAFPTNKQPLVAASRGTSSPHHHL